MGLREAYQEKVNAQLCEWQAWIEQIKKDPTIPNNRGSAERKRSITQLEDCLRIAQVRFEELCLAQDERWELTKQAVERAMIDLKQALDRYGTAQAGRIIRLQDSRSYAIYPFDRKG
jgi:hypothetical protein